MDDILLFVLTFILGFIIGIKVTIEVVQNKPQAIDVYRGRTSLQIIYEGDHADSTVTFKIDSLIVK